MEKVLLATTNPEDKYSDDGVTPVINNQTKLCLIRTKKLDKSMFQPGNIRYNVKCGYEMPHSYIIQDKFPVIYSDRVYTAYKITLSDLRKIDKLFKKFKTATPTFRIININANYAINQF